MRGRRPTPTAVKKANGNPGRRKLNKKEPSAGSKLKKPPFLGSYGAKMWDATIKQLEAMGLLDGADHDSLMLWCLAYDDLRTNREFIKKHGATFVVIDQAGNKIIREHPAARGAREAWKAMRGMLTEFGFTPSARVRLGSKEDDGDGEFNSLMAQLNSN